MAEPAGARRLERRPEYAVVPDPPGGWRVTARRGRRGRGGFADCAAALAHAERLAAGHLVAQIRVFADGGLLERDEAVRNAERCREAREWLEAYLARFRDYLEVRALLADDWYVENRLVEVVGETVWLSVLIHEGQAWDEIYVRASLYDEPSLPPIADSAFMLWGW